MKKMFFILVMVLVAGGLAASGITLYSYQDERGQTIVVDSLERIPEQYRDGAKRGFIPSFRSDPAPKKPSAVIETVPDAVVEHPARQTDDQFSVTPPPEEIELDTGLASASQSMAQLRLLHLNYERIYIAARDNGLQFPSIGPLHLANNQLIIDFRFPEAMSTDAGRAWLEKARIFFDQLKGLQYNVGIWLSQYSQELLSTMPMLTARAKVLLNELETAFSAIPAGK
ncbi:MAG: hypothetical protein CVV42_20250 [Candidatus Riflebacteria bacterium HGW-Riflebacteria-2]|jgi:hypothetical protein|nr:MAG: hypothetical protein CVV42_20250 [Candidatus Riflebacteria bacterium HGW-Riflebacteria-2]